MSDPTWVTVCTGHIGDTSSPRGGSDALEGVFFSFFLAWDPQGGEITRSSKGPTRGRTGPLRAKFHFTDKPTTQDLSEKRAKPATRDKRS